MVYKFFDKKSKGSGVNTQAEPLQKKYKNNERLAEKLHKPSIRSFKKGTVYSRSKDNIWGTDLADMQLKASLIQDLDFYYVLLIFLVDMLGLFL